MIAFSPRLDTNSPLRLAMALSPEQSTIAYQRGRWRAVLTNLHDGHSYKVRGASCGLPGCYCDAVIVSHVD